MSLLEITNLNYSYGDKVIYKNASLSLYKGDHMGIVGHNGVGKSTLISLCGGDILPDSGSVVWDKRISVGHLDQYAKIDKDCTILEFMKSAYKELYKIEKELSALYADVDNLEKNWAIITQYQNKLDAANFYQIDTSVDKIANGLGLTAIGLNSKISEISGGQRAKVILAKLLLKDPDVLLLDEPTNFLDVQHIDWLADYLSESKRAFMVVSHDYAFLERISNCICDVDNGEMRKYVGKFSDYIKQKEHAKEDYRRRYEAQQKEIKKTEEYIRKNIAGVNSKNAKGRRKQLERLERLAPPSQNKAAPVFSFKALSGGEKIHIQAEDLAVGYYYKLFSGLNLTISSGEKIVITGFNGIGKSTLIKTLLGQLKPLGGKCRLSDKIKVGYYEQGLKWENADSTPMQVVADVFPNMSEKEIRASLSKCAVSSEHAKQAVGTLSGGEQAKVKLCLLTLSPCHMLIMDEPTNHLDEQAKKSLKEALKIFEGSLLLVSHEKAFYEDFADDIADITKCLQK